LIPEILDHWLIQAVVMATIVLGGIYLLLLALANMISVKAKAAMENIPKVTFGQGIALMFTTPEGREQAWGVVKHLLKMDK